MKNAVNPHCAVQRETTECLACKSARKSEREELVCRLLVSALSMKEISIILKIRKEEIETIQLNNSESKIPEYERTYKARMKYWERTFRASLKNWESAKQSSSSCATSS